MPKASFVALVAGLGLLVACAPSSDDIPAPTPEPGPAGVTAPPAQAPPTNDTKPTTEEAAATPGPEQTTTWKPAARVELPGAPELDESDAESVKAYCAFYEANRPTRGSFTGAPADADVTAHFDYFAPEPGVANLAIRIGLPPVRRESAQNGLERVDAWQYRYFTIDSTAGADAFAVGTYETARFAGSGGSNVCYVGGGMGGSSMAPGDAVKLVITKRTADLIEGTFGDTSFSAAIPVPGAATEPRICCL